MKTGNEEVNKKIIKKNKNEEKIKENNIQNEKEEENKKKITLENCDFSLKMERINSPHSLKALSLLGINEEELYKLSFDEFKNENLEIQDLPKELQKFHYEAYEKFRNKIIEKLKEKRKKIIEKKGENEIDNEEMKRILKKQIDIIKNKTFDDILKDFKHKKYINKNIDFIEKERKKREKEVEENKKNKRKKEKKEKEKKNIEKK